MTNKEKLWEAIERYRCSGGRDEHQANKYLLDTLINEVVKEEHRAGHLTATLL